MSMFLPPRPRPVGQWLLMALLPLLPFAAQAQLGYAAGNALNTTTTYTDLGTNGTAIATANTDDANSAAQDIGFSFTYNGTAFTQFVLNTNGLIKLGNVVPSTAALYYDAGQGVDPLDPLAGAPFTNLIMPFNADLQPGTAPAEYRVQTTGTAPTRVCTIQWKNVSDKPYPGANSEPSQYANFSFQAKLYENGNIEFVYGAATASASVAAAKYPNVGLKGSSTDVNQVVLATKLSATAWSGTAFINRNYSEQAHNISKLVLPDAGRTYRFVPGQPCNDPTAANLVAGNTSVQINVTPGAGTVGYNVTYSAGGPFQTLTPAPTTAPITIPNLIPGTVYTVTLQSICATGTGSVLIGQTQTTGTPPPSPYVALPYTESFESPWTNGLSLRDLPTVNWRNTPATSDNSWRREDDGFASAQWQFQDNETPNPAPGNLPPPYVTRSSTGAHSARFHTFGADSLAQGRLDLYANMSGAAAKTLSFDYINPTGVDKLEVFVSTDGGATFAPIPVLTATTSSTFANQTATITSSSATTVIRFQATSDFGRDDIGIDNLRLGVLTSTRNEALAATVGLYPSPTHRGFKLTVPAGSLPKASATLADALGKVVQRRQLSLPASGGTADFDVSNLAPGVYSLQLQTAADLVVKRVVIE